MARDATLRQLKVFESVARHLNFSRAAEELHLTQPAVSTQIRMLEEHCGVALFEQLGKKVYLTPAGAKMLHHGRIIIEQFREAQQAMAQFADIAGGTLNISIVSTGDYFFPHLLAEFTKRYQDIQLNLQVSNREQLLSQLAHNRTDVAVMVRPPQDRDLSYEPFAPHPYVIVAAPGHPRVNEAGIALNTLANESFIAREDGSDTRAAMKESFSGRLDDFKLAMEISSTETIKQAVMAGMGISFLSAHTVSLELQVGLLKVLDVKGFPAMHKWYVVHRKNKQLPAVAMAFKEFLLADGAALIYKITRVH